MNRIISTTLFTLIALGCSSENAKRGNQAAQRAPQQGNDVEVPSEDPGEGEGGDTGGGGGSDIASIAANGYRACAVLVDGRVKCWGDVELGGPDAYPGSITSPAIMPDLTNVAELALGPFFTCARHKDGTVSCFGSNFYGQLGDGTTTARLTPGKVDINNVVAMGTGSSHVCAVKGDGTVWCWGANGLGQLGNPQKKDCSDVYPDTDPCSRTPVQVPGITNAKEVVGGGEHTCVLTNDGSVWCFGSNTSGELGDGTRSGPITRPGPPGGFKGRITPEKVAGLSNVQHIAGSHDTSCAVLSSGTLMCWGRRIVPIGTPSTSDTTPTAILDNVAGVSIGDFDECATRLDGTVWCWGTNNHGSNGDGTTPGHADPRPLPGLSGIVQVDVRTQWAGYVLRGDGAIFAWGFNAAGQLGDGTRVDRMTPVRTSGF